ncbi:MAG: ammonia monooxygenase [Phyllobacteriaceae bacterium]|nr:ammonia monooxygenase [Phyllobacteriaceae bacterium]MBA91504.1 ammonia monooxygenase [Phyllobacteriaceae bacterium]
MPRTELLRSAMPFAAAIAAGASGAALAFLAGVPAPFLTGPAVAVTLCGLAGARMGIPARIRDFAFIMIGLSMGSGVTPDVTEALTRWPVSLAALVAAVVTIMLVSRAALVRFTGAHGPSAVLSSAPGHLSYVLAMAEQSGLDVRLIGIVQSMRVLFLTLAVPPVVELAGLSRPGSGLAAETMPAVQILAALALAGVAGWGFKRVNLPAAYLLGGMLVSTGGHLGGALTGGLPLWLSTPAFVLLGTLIGTRFSGVTPGELRRALGAGLLITVISVVIAAAAAAVASALTGIDFGAMLIALSPGGVETMTAMATLMGADPAFVAAHHVSRLLFLAAFVPFLLVRQKRRKGDGADQ